MIGMSPVGKWTLDLSNPDVRQLFLTGLVEDILFVVMYRASFPSRQVKPARNSAKARE